MNLGISLSASATARRAEPTEEIQQDAAMAAADLYNTLHTGKYRTQGGQIRRIDGDMSKLPFAESITKQQRRILADFRFRTKLLPGT